MSTGSLPARLRHLRSAAATVLHMAADDRAWLAVQAGRRLPAPLRNKAGALAIRNRFSPVLAAWGNLLLDRSGPARERLRALTSHGPVSGSLAIHAGLEPGPGAAPADQARWAWLTGDLDAARALVDAGSLPPRLHQKVQGDLEALEPGPRPVPTATRTWDVDPEAPRVLHVLTNSKPWTRSGYTLRSQAILTAQRGAGIAVAAMTRPAYPVSIGKVLGTDLDVFDGIHYYRCIPGQLPPGEAQRIDVWAEHLVRAAERHRATHLHSTTHYPNALAAQAAARALGLPWVHEVRGQLERTWASGRARHGDRDPYGSSRFRTWRAREAEVAAAADHVITLSQTMRQDLISRGVDPARVSVIPNGIAPDLLQRTVTPADARARLGLDRDGFWVGSVSSVVHYEGLGDLVEAVALARKAGHDVRGAIVGDGVAWPELATRVQDLGLQDVFLLPGRLPRQESLAWLDALDAVVIPRQDHEVTRLVPPLKLVEAMGAGRPVIASDLPALAELITPEQTGLLTSPGAPTEIADAITRLTLDQRLRERLVAGGRQAARELTWPSLAESYRDTYHALSPASVSEAWSGREG